MLLSARQHDVIFRKKKVERKAFNYGFNATPFCIRIQQSHTYRMPYPHKHLKPHSSLCFLMHSCSNIYLKRACRLIALPWPLTTLGRVSLANMWILRSPLLHKFWLTLSAIVSIQVNSWQVRHYDLNHSGEVIVYSPHININFGNRWTGCPTHRSTLRLARNVVRVAHLHLH